ncbi:unnamed protein product, partial [Ectocarpus sp. 12 AP-2014]
HALVENECLLSALNKAPPLPPPRKPQQYPIYGSRPCQVDPPAPPIDVAHGDDHQESNSIDFGRRINDEAGDNN